MKQQSFFPKNKQRDTAIGRMSLVITLVGLTSLMLVGLIQTSGAVVSRAKSIGTPAAGAANSASVSQQATSVAITTSVVPGAVGTVGAPAPINTAGAPTLSAPDAIATTQAAKPNSSNNSSRSSARPAPPGSAAASTNSSFPWLLVALALLVLLALIGFFMARARRSAVEAAPAGVGGGVPAPRTPGAYTGGTGLPPPTQVAPVAAPVAASMPPQPTVITELTGTVVCPNCGTANANNENFCHECGQDLRPTRASMIAAAAPPPQEAVAEDIPYLETLDRVDEQLEFVLSRSRVAIGAAPGNDIVIDSAYKSWQTVSPSHAELQREQNDFTIVDHDSENGTFVNEMRTGENLLSDGDLVRLGDVRFVFHVPKVE